jgi:2'-5' RNA ligase
MGIKLFIGTQIASDLAEEIGRKARSLEGARGWRRAPRWQWHVTALFIGMREEAQVDAIAQAVQRTCEDRKRIALYDGHLVAMPEEQARMLWIRFTPSEDLSALHHRLAKATSTPPSQHHPLWPHITLARGKGLLPTLSDTLIIPRLDLLEISLFRSDPGPDGPIHSKLGTWPLT